MQSGDLTAAERILAQTGTHGITSIELNELKDKLEQRSGTLAVQRRGGALLADIQAGTVHGESPLTMVVDTGATLTAISLTKLRELGATRTSFTVEAQTAHGRVTLPIYQLQSLVVGPLTLTDVKVAALTETLSTADGLLGLDIIDQLPNPIVTEP